MFQDFEPSISRFFYFTYKIIAIRNQQLWLKEQDKSSDAE